MSVENVTKFYNKVLKDEVLKGKLGGVNEKTLTKEVFESKVLPEAKAKGYDFTYEDVQEYYKKQSEKTELNVDELEDVSGGGSCGDDVKTTVIGQTVNPNDKACDYFTGKNNTPRDKAKCSDCSSCQMVGYEYVCKINASR